MVCIFRKSTVYHINLSFSVDDMSEVEHVEVTGLAGTVFFFFQAEYGIRDDLVTGVQTCALPI